MREKLETLSLTELKELAKAQGFKVSGKKKEELIDLLCELDEKLKAEKAALIREEKRKKELARQETNGPKPVENQSLTQVQKASDNTESAATEESEDARKDIGANGILEITEGGFGFIRSDNFLTGNNDVYVSSKQLKYYGLKTGDVILGIAKESSTAKFPALNEIKTVNGYSLEDFAKRKNFDHLTPTFPDKRIKLTRSGEKSEVSLRVLDLVSPIGCGQRGMIVSPPKAGKTTLLKLIAQSIIKNYPSMHLIILLVDERPEEVTDMKDEVKGKKVEIIYSTFDEIPQRHAKVAEMVIERAKRLCEHGEDVVILLDSITRLARAYNLTCTASGRTLSGGLDPSALHMPKKFFGAARNMREGGSITILATALIETGSRMDDVIYEEFKGTGNMELVLNRKLQERRIFPAIDILKSGTRKDNLLLSDSEIRALDIIHRIVNDPSKDETSTEAIIDLFSKTSDNEDFTFQLEKKYGIMMQK